MLTIALHLALSLAPQQPSSAPAPAPAAASPVVGVSHFASCDGLRIHLWQKCLADGAVAAARAGKVAILVHGATWSGRPDFDLQIRDYSLMDRLARAGYDAWAIDIHGYGLSDKTDRDWSDTASAARDLQAAVEYVCALRKVEQVKLLGWSWGTQITGLYAMDHPERVSRLVLYGPVWNAKRKGKVPTEQYRTNTAAGARSDFIAGQFEEDVVDAYVKAALEADPKSPNGVIVDMLTKLPMLDPARITCPTMVLRPEHDFASTQPEMLAFFEQLKTADKCYVSLPDGGHAIILEKGYRRFQDVVLAFFDRQ